MNRQRNARLITIMNNVERIEEETMVHFNNGQNQQGNCYRAPYLTSEVVLNKTQECFNIEEHQRQNTDVDVTPTTSEASTAKKHEYTLRESTKAITYFEENERDGDFSPDASEYLPSPERMTKLQQCESPFSIGGNSDYIEAASQNIAKTPSTISNISLVLNTVDFIASPSEIYVTNNQFDTPKALTERLDLKALLESNEPLRYKTKSSLRRCLDKSFRNDNQPSTAYASYSYIDDYEVEIEEEPTPSLVDSNTTLQPENTSDSLLSNSTIVIESIANSSQNLTQQATGYNGEQHAEEKDKEEQYGQGQIEQEHNGEEKNAALPNRKQDQEGQEQDNEVNERIEQEGEEQERQEQDSKDQEGLEQDGQEKDVRDQEGLEQDGEEQDERDRDVEELDTTTPGQELPKLTRKRKQNFDKRQDVMNKKLKNLGEAYEGSRSKKKYDKKDLKAACKCTKKCSEKITQEERESIMKQYYKIGDHEKQWQYIVNHTIVKDVKRITVERKRTRTQTITYFFTKHSEKVQVCKTFFINTLSISHQTVYTALEKSKPDKNFIDKRGRHENRPRKMPVETQESIIQHIELFPTVESHYIRKDSTRKYLSELLNISKMYRLYRKWFGQQTFDFLVATKRQYETIFNTRFNYSFFKPKKDQCSQCTRYRQADSSTQLILQEKYDKHRNNKDRVRQLKKEEKESVNPSETTVAIFDLEKVLNIPQSEVGSFHYKRKYPVYNFTVYNATQNTGHCYVWHGQIAKRGANEVGSCLWQFLLNEKQRGIQNVSFYSDGCCGQNKNRFIFALYIYAAHKLQLNITHRFFETGHGQSEGDSMHSNIERELKNRVVYTPDQMYTIIMNAKVHGKKYQVKEMTQTEFYNIKELIDNKNWIKDKENQKVSWTQIMEVNVSNSNPLILKYKYNFDSDFFQLNTEPVRRIRSRRATGRLTIPSPGYVPELQRLYTEPIPISKALYDDLMSLCKAGDIPSYYRGFYESLTYDNSSSKNDNEEDHND